jgi:hypothetical protein
MPPELDIINVLAGVGLFFVLLFVAAWLLSRFRGRGEVYPFARIPVLTDAELNFHDTLRTCLPPGTVLLMKVRLADFLHVTERGDDYLRHFGRISQKHADFLLVDSQTFLPLLVIELDDSTHRRNQRTMDSDELKNSIYSAAELSILRVPAARTYNAEELRRMVRSFLPAKQAKN